MMTTPKTFDPLRQKAYHLTVQLDSDCAWEGPRAVLPLEGGFTKENDRVALAHAKAMVEAFEAGYDAEGELREYTCYVAYGTRYDHANDSAGYVTRAWDSVNVKAYTFVKTRRLGYVEAHELSIPGARTF